MTFLGGLISIGNVSTMLLVVFSVLFLGYALGRIKIKGISLGDAGVFLIALLVGALFFGVNESGSLLFDFSGNYDYTSGLSLVESLGLILFVTSVGYMAGPRFVQNLKRNFKLYAPLGVLIPLMGGIIGVISGVGLAELISNVMQIPVAISVPAIMISVVFSMLIGIVFGLVPAVKAANLNPIEALRRN